MEAYLIILAKQDWCKGYEYIDAFAGTGKPQSRDEEIFVDGSPRVALSLKKPFTHYHFIEESPWRVKKLEELREEFTGRKISIYQGDSNKILIEKMVPQLSYVSKKKSDRFYRPLWDATELGNFKSHCGGQDN
ncbi:MAG: three-Cys-motif partner protein TcmP [Deltaproteobacteria bacterium]|nr:three-Cys-motif partner protein TcmP [Deltaproteobacteria bacterium]